MDNKYTTAVATSSDIKAEPANYPELVRESDLILDNDCIKNETCDSQNNDNVNLDSSEQVRCSQCNEGFPEFKYIQVHEAVHDLKLHCPVCDRIFKLKKYFVPHIQMHLKDPFRCQHCPEIFFDKRSYNSHLYVHRQTKTYTCGYCLKKWNNKKDLTVHIRVHTNERPYSCDACGKSFKQKGGLSSHIFTLHSRDKKVIKETYNCEVCNGLYSSISSLNKHMRKIHETGKTFPCKNCGETFLNFKQMKEHKRLTHPEGAYNRICPMCNQMFLCREAFASHQCLQSETGQNLAKASAATPIDCYLCGDQILGMRAFSKHQQFHLLMTDDEMEACTKAKLFNCKVCGKKFNFKKNLFRHMDVHLEKTFQCANHCSEKFTYLGIQLHLEWFFEQFHCSECDETFTGKKSLKKHYEKHQAAINFSCRICGYKFRFRRLLITHWKMQHNLKCHLCLKKFVTHLDLRRHIKLRHRTNNAESTVPIKRKNPENGAVVTPAQKYKCKVCKHYSETAHLLNDHMKLHKKKCFQCENCKKNFLYFRNWMFHMRQNICLKYFDNTNGMTRLSCLVCKKEFGAVHSLISHVGRHTTIHRCKFCNVKFKQRDLQDHINRHHPSELKYFCDKCSLRFCSQNDLSKHGRYFHKSETNYVIKEESTTENPEDEGRKLDENDVEVDEGHSVWIKEEPTHI